MSKKTSRHYYWARTFMEGGGISLTPKNPNSRYPLGYLVYGPRAVMNFFPATDPNVNVREGVIEISGPETTQNKIYTHFKNI